MSDRVETKFAPMFGEPVSNWFRWFAWRPVETVDRGWRWLRPVWKRRIQKHQHLDGGGDFWFQHAASVRPSRPVATPQISRPSGLGEQEEGETSGQKLGVHSVRARHDPEGSGDRGVHGGPGILAGPGSGPTGRRPAGADGRRGLSESTPTGDMPVGADRPSRPAEIGSPDALIPPVQSGGDSA